MTFSATDITVAVGQRGCGKSSLGRQVASAYPRLIVIDRVREWTNYVDFATDDFNEFAQYLIDHCEDSHFKIAFQFDVEADNKGAVFSEVVRLSYKLGNCCVLIEEAHHFASPTSIDPWLFEMTLTGRHQSIAMILSSQRCAHLHKALISQADHVFIGPHFEKRDLEYLADTVGQQATEAVKKLRKFSFVHYDRKEMGKISVVESQPY